MVVLIYDDDTDLYMPACFILCSHKNTDIYYKIFKYIQENIMISQYNLQRVTLDFEESLREGIHQAFNGLTFIGCKFHLNQAIQRKAKKKGLLSSNLEKETRDIIDKINKIL